MTRGFAVHGTVRGVGFRPFAQRIAGELRLTGRAANAGGHVEGAVTGPADAAVEFG
ncbi:acylphosphatase [Streptomyces sp. PmtG]